MTALPGGMESDFSDSECDIVFKTDSDTKPKKVHVPFAAPDRPVSQTSFEKKKVSNGVVNHPSRRKEDRQPPHRAPRRQCLEMKTSQVLDDMRYAIMQGDLDTLTSILAKGIMVDTVLKAGWTGLMYACSFGNPEIVSYLLKMKADPNYHKDMFTPLMAVCASNKNEDDLLKCCTLLLQHGANVNAHERHYTTALMFAAREGFYLVTKELLEHGANPNLQDNRGNTALACAATRGHGLVARLLLEKGADRSTLNNMGQSPADLAYESGHAEIVALLKKDTIEPLSVDSSQLVKATPAKEMASPFRSAPKSFVKVGDLELFLNGVGLPDLIPKFTEHQLGFQDLLIMDDEELEKMGITQVGVRKKILEASRSVHKKEWKTSSLPNLKQNQYISCPDAVSMMANIAKHLKYISSSVIYVRQQIQSQPRILELSQDSANVHDLLDELEDGLKNVRFLNDEIRFLKLHLQKVQDQVQFIPADLIVETVPSEQSRKRILLVAIIGITACSAIVTGLAWKNPNVVDSISSFIRIRLPSPR